MAKNTLAIKSDMTHDGFMTHEERISVQEQTIRVMVDATCDVLRDAEEIGGPEHGRAIFMSFLSTMISVVVSDSLLHPMVVQDNKTLRVDYPSNTTPKSSEADRTRQFELTHKSFTATKAQIADAIAAGFTGGFLSANPEHVLDYYVEILAVPEPKNRMLV